MEINYYTDGNSNDFADTVMEIGLGYIIIGAFVYIPFIILLNIVKLINPKPHSDQHKK